MLNSINIDILCQNFDEAKDFYIENLGFFITMDIINQYDSGTSRRLIMTHKSNTKFSIEFMSPSSLEQAKRIGTKGGTINLFTLPTKNIESIKERLEKTAFFINYTEVPYASFLTLEDPMGNNICLYEAF
ncbi:VOC family protein [Janthinobacterium sp.]|uniref:VOC family protein n=1 Tax=Janthinobacterium sp. TaxID=1871054 RepID=UPI0028A11404|nr:VOC family protein [Janthinobacterium sp.]